MLNFKEGKIPVGKANTFVINPKIITFLFIKMNEPKKLKK